MASSISFSQFTPAPILSIPPPDFNISSSEAAIQSDDTEKEESGELDLGRVFGFGSIPVDKDGDLSNRRFGNLSQRDIELTFDRSEIKN